MLLKEIVGMPPLPYKWLTGDTAEFFHNQTQFGIVLEHVPLSLPNKSVVVVNISFGLVIDSNKPVSATNINRSLTGTGKPYTILSTVAQACISHGEIQQNDIIVVAASDAVKDKRINTYTMALYELAANMPQFKHYVTVKSPNGTILVAVSKDEFTQDEQQYIIEQLGITKIL